MKELAGLIFGIIWVAGFVIAQGFWSTVFCIFPFWSFYLVVERFLIDGCVL